MTFYDPRFFDLFVQLVQLAALSVERAPLFQSAPPEFGTILEVLNLPISGLLALLLWWIKTGDLVTRGTMERELALHAKAITKAEEERQRERDGAKLLYDTMLSQQERRYDEMRRDLLARIEEKDRLIQPLLQTAVQGTVLAGRAANLIQQGTTSS